MTPFEEVMVVYKQVMMLLNHASHRCLVEEADLDGNQYIGRWIAATPEAAQEIFELLKTKTKVSYNIRSYFRDGEFHVNCPVTYEESRKVRHIKDF